MTDKGTEAARVWRETGYATKWANSDSLQELLAVPRVLAAELVLLDRPGATRFVDIASGTGTFLAVFLDAFPEATGLWTDVSDEMLAMAKENLAPYGDRVEYKLVDMTDLSDVDTDVDVLMTSRAAHHLDRAALHDFYADARKHLADGGWLINLDHVHPKDEDWNRLMRDLRKKLSPPKENTKPHHHNYPLTSITDHTDALTAAGLTDHEVAWRALISCMFVARNH